MGLPKSDKPETTPRRFKEPSMFTHFKAFAGDESGATAIEYALIASLIAVAIVGALTSLGTKLSSEFGEVSGYLK
jgi:pilus assembly protein Flp/PilA